eukprot:COSAG02_NODE_63_length_43286_cov_54.666412_18_plen_45_part_00
MYHTSSAIGGVGSVCGVLTLVLKLPPISAGRDGGVPQGVGMVVG